jgi:hypothetical protein
MDNAWHGQLLDCFNRGWMSQVVPFRKMSDAAETGGGGLSDTAGQIR